MTDNHSSKSAYGVKPLALVICEEMEPVVREPAGALAASRLGVFSAEASEEVLGIIKAARGEKAKEAPHEPCSIENYAERLTEALEPYFRTLPPISRGADVWSLFFEEIPSLIIVSRTIRDVDAISLVRSIRSGKYSFDIRFFLTCREVNRSVESIVEHNGFDGAYSVFDPVEKTAKAISEAYASLAAETEKRRARTLRGMIDDSFFFSDIERERMIGKNISKSLLAPLGLNTEHKGTEYLRLLIAMRVFGAEGDMKTLYSSVGAYYGVSGAAVEKSIRYAIEQAWSGGSPYMQYYLFGNSVDENRGKPTNSEFIATMVRHTIERVLKGDALADE